MAAAVFTLTAGCGGATVSPARTDAGPADRRVLVLSVDALSEARLRHSLATHTIPAIRSVLDAGACADGSIPAFPSLTAPSHAALWTGAYGDVNGIAANVQPQLPRASHRLTGTASGFSSQALLAEPVWVTLAHAGFRATGHHATQSSTPPGYIDDASTRHLPLPALRNRAARAYASGRLALLNGYDAQLVPERVLDARRHPPRAAPPWDGIDPAASPVPREVTVSLGSGGDSLHVLFVGQEGRYTHVLLATQRSAATAVRAVPAPVDTTPLAGRALARHFAPALPVRIDGLPAHVNARLFDLAPDLAAYTLYLPGVAHLLGNDAALARAYDAATQGWEGNSAVGPLRRGDFGVPIAAGGSGSAEWRWLETAEFATRQSIRGAAFLWDTRPNLLADYFSLGDNTDHTFLGLVDPMAPHHDQAMAARAQRVRERAWALVDMRVAAAHALVRAAGGTLVLVGDHGMRTSWGHFRPNVALARAGLLRVDATGAVVAAQSRAFSPGGYYVAVNRVGWRDGLVPGADEAAIIDSIVHALLSVTDSTGEPVVTRTWRAAAHDSLGLGGPTGGDVYFALRRGYAYSADASGPAASGTRVAAGHGHPSIDRDMHTVLCVTGPGFSARRISAVRNIDLAPTLLEMFGVEPAPTVRGRSLLKQLRTPTAEWSITR